MDSYLDSSIKHVKGIGEKVSQIFQKEFGINTVRDTLYHFPRRYVDKTSLTPISQLQINQLATTYGIVNSKKIIGKYGKGRLVVSIIDNNYSIQLMWFNNYSWIYEKLQMGKKICVFGTITEFNRQLQISHPEFDDYNVFIKNNNILEAVYPSSEKLKKVYFTNKKYNTLYKLLFSSIQRKDISEIHSKDFLVENKLISLYDALYNIHLPSNFTLAKQAEYRLKFDEFFLHHIQLLALKAKRKKEIEGFIFKDIGKYFNSFYHNHLTFELTDDQKKVITEIRKDMKSGYQMNRLLQGDVGSGKTLVSLLACLIAIDNQYQTCLMVPTEVLARQHYKTFSSLTKGLKLNVQLLVSSVKEKDKKMLANMLINGDINILIGTHALIEDYVRFKQLGLAIIDEQHRFGVEHRSKLWGKNSKPPHMLVMTATPIPRTMAMSVYGDLDTSTIKQLPKGRKKVLTVHREEAHRMKIYDFIKQEIQKGGQAYIIYPLIEESKTLDYENVMDGYKNIKAYFPEPTYHISMVHGKQNSKEKETNMRRFEKKDTQIMVSTTVIEVGIDVPNANIMLIESAERFGLSQLHQLRGRIGRGSRESYCILLSTQKLTDQSKQRLQILCDTNDGFVISEKDMEIRGSGDIIGTKQSGEIPFKIADPIYDKDIMNQSFVAAKKIIDQDFKLKMIKHVTLRKYIETLSSNQSFWGEIS